MLFVILVLVAWPGGHSPKGKELCKLPGGKNKIKRHTSDAATARVHPANVFTYKSGTERRTNNPALPPRMHSRSRREGGHTAKYPHRGQHPPVAPILRPRTSTHGPNPTFVRRRRRRRRVTERVGDMKFSGTREARRARGGGGCPVLSCPASSM